MRSAAIGSAPFTTIGYAFPVFFPFFSPEKCFMAYWADFSGKIGFFYAIHLLMSFLKLSAILVLPLIFQ